MTMPETDTIWLNGEFVPWNEAKVHVLTHGLHYGTGVFEGIRCYDTPRGPAIFRMPEHLERMHRAARVVRMPMPYSVKELGEVIVRLVRDNHLESCYIRPIAFRGYGGLGLNTSLIPVDIAIAAWPWGTYLGEDALQRGIRVTISSWRRNDPNVIPPDCKLTGAYITSCVATVEANDAGFDEALMLDQAGYVAEGTGENIFLVVDGGLITPPVEGGALPGITRASILEIAQDLGIDVVTRNVSRSDLYRADEAFCVGTAAEVVPIRSVDGRELGDPGVITRVVQDRFFSIVRGEDDKYLDWFTFVHDTATVR